METEGPAPSDGEVGEHPDRLPSENRIGRRTDMEKTKNVRKRGLTPFAAFDPVRGFSTGAKVGAIPIKLVAGSFSPGKVGSLLGLGVAIGNNNLQLLRMDYHVFNKNHGGLKGLKDDELKVLHKGSYHMHVYRWGIKLNGLLHGHVRS